MMKARKFCVYPLIVAMFALIFFLTLMKGNNQAFGTHYVQKTVAIDMQTAVPDAPAMANLYKRKPLSNSDIDNLKKQFGMTSGIVETDTPEVYRISEGDKIMIFERLSGTFIYLDEPHIETTQPISITTNTAAMAAQTWLDSKLPEQIPKERYLKSIGNAQEQDDLGNMFTTKYTFNYGGNLFNGDETVSVTGPGGKLFMSVGENENINLVVRNMPDVQLVGTKATISGAEALTKLEENPQNWIRVPPLNGTTVTITTAELAYYVPMSGRALPQIELVYIFVGNISDGQKTEEFMQVVPAFVQTEIPELMDEYPMIPDEGGQILDKSGQAGATFLPSSVIGTMTVTVEEKIGSIDPWFTPPKGLVPLGQIYDFKATSSFTTATITMSIDPVFDINKSDVFRWSGSNWDKITTGRKIDPGSRTISVDVDHFTLYAVFGPTPATGFSTNMLLVVAAGFLLLGFIILRRPAWKNSFSIIVILAIAWGMVAAPVVLAHHQTVYAAGIRYYNNFRGCPDVGSDLPHASFEAWRLYYHLITYRDFSGATHSNYSPSAYHWEEQDHNFVEQADLAYFAGHGSNARIWFTNPGFPFREPPDCSGDAGEMRLGDWFSQDLDIVAFASSNTLKLTPATTWEPAFKGLRQMFGYATSPNDNNAQGILFAKLMDGGYGRLHAWHAWILSGLATQWHWYPSSRQVVIGLHVHDAGFDTYFDHLEGFGHGGPPRNPDPTDVRASVYYVN